MFDDNEVESNGTLQESKTHDSVKQTAKKRQCGRDRVFSSVSMERNQLSDAILTEGPQLRVKHLTKR